MHTTEPARAADLPLEAYRCCPAAQEAHGLPHFHNRVEFVAVIRGVVRCSAWGAEALCAAGDVAAFNPGALHAIVPERGAEYAGVLFRYDTLEPRTPDVSHSRYIAPYQRGERLLPLRLAGSSLCAEICKIADIYLARRAGFELELKALLFTLMALLVVNGPDDEETNYASNLTLEPDSPIHRTLEFINAHFSQKIYLDQLAGIANMNKNYFCEYFKAHTGYTPVEYLNIVRVGEARRLLRGTNRKLADIAFEVGFNNLSYFTQTFHSISGILPSKCRGDGSGPLPG